ncbi:PREDICTED: serine protease easter-like, partial [Nicrophorus vespilloides]|uniref:Serine protease easter-like n=1 Tax=Nicrophorus vespilloides TaxID=110193 RepID=A0ABM1MSU7_NICVS
YIMPICLPNDKVQQFLIQPRMVLEVAGWGKTKNMSASNIKMKARVPIVDRETCAKNKAINIANSQICAGGAKEDSCSGDSGGPLMARDLRGGDDRWYVSGVVSFGPRKCATKGAPGVYTNVAPYVAWIKAHMKP